MKVILDTNILISALIRNSMTRAIISFSPNEFYYPEKALNEINKYKSFILEKSKLEEDDYEDILEKLLKRITLIEEDEINPHLKEAEEAIGKVDPKDVIFIASALTQQNSVIWSDDRHFEKQNKIKLVKTPEMISDFRKQTGI